MRISSVDLPLRLIESRRAGKFVVFAGAGVSKPAPSSLPEFEALVKQIAGDSLERKDREPPDHFLGRLTEKGIPAHDRTARIIGNPDSRPSNLHRLLVELFPRPENLRIVTTNFDRHFETAIREKWPDAVVNVYAAPALPVGSRFAGLGYLHGRLGGDSRDLVLTDSDFGRAYLTEGWARRFFRNLIDTYDLLFVGYSHHDVVLSYLARGLPATGDRVRFALTQSGEPEHWQFLGITPIEYDPASNHAALGEALQGWLDLEGRGALRHEREIQQLVERSPQALTEQEADYLLFCLRDAVLAQFFYRHANAPEWLVWADERSILAPLFNADTGKKDITDAACWFVREPLSSRGEVAREILHKAGYLSQILWDQIAHSVWRALDNDNLTPEAVELAAQWLSVLDLTGDARSASDIIDYWLLRLTPERHTFLALHLFTYLTRPISIGERGLQFREDEGPEWKLKTTVKIRGDQHWLRQIWGNLFVPNLDVFALHLAPLVTAHLHQAHMLLRSQGGASEQWDPMSYGRPAVEPHEQNEHRAHEAFDVLIDAARDILDWMIRNEPAMALYYIEAGFSAEAPLVRRLSIYGLAKHPGIRAGRKIDNVVKRGWLGQWYLRHEVFFLLREAYKASSQSARRRLLRETERVFMRQYINEDAESVQTAKYETFKLLVWLGLSDPYCSLVAAALEDMRREHPDFKAHDHLDFSSWSSGVHAVRTLSPVGLDDLLQLAPREWLLEFDKVKAEERDPLVFEDTVVGFLEETERATSQEFVWGVDLAEYLCAEGLWSNPAWHYLFRAWAGAALPETEWGQLLALLGRHAELFRHATDMADVLQRRVEKHDLPATEEMVVQGLGIAERLWPSLSNEAEKAGSDTSDWVQLGLNKAGGKLGLFVVHALSRVYAIHGEEWNGIPQRFLPLLESMAAASSQSSPLGRVMLASQLHFMFGIDTEWTRANLLPLFDWTRDPQAAEQAWHGFLTWGRPRRELLTEFMPYVIQTFDHMDELKSQRRRFSEYLAWIAYGGLQDPLEGGWIRDYLRKTVAEDRKTWASTIGSILGDIDRQERVRVWNTWLRRYMELRLESGIAIENEEWTATIEWSLELVDNLPELVELLIRLPAPSHAARASIYYQLSERLDLLLHPEALADLLLYLMAAEERLHHHCGYVGEIVERLLSAGASRGKLRAIVDRLAALGCQNAQELAARL